MLQQKIESDLHEAMKSGNQEARSTLRMLLASLHNREIELRKKEVGLSEEEVMAVIASEVKRRADAAEAFALGGRGELASRERTERAILESYLPPQLADEELVRAAREAIHDIGARSELDFARVIKVLMPAVKGIASGERVARILREELVKYARGHE